MSFPGKNREGAGAENPGPPPEKAPPRERIAITGIGFVSPLGLTAWDSVLAIQAGDSNTVPFKAVLVADNEERSALRAATVSRVDGLDPWLDGTERALAMMKPALRECTTGLPEDVLKIAMCEVDNLLTPDDPDFLEGLKSEFPRLPLRPEEDKTAAQMPRCAFFERIIRAAEKMQQNQLEMALVGCVDSTADFKRLYAINETGRLISAANIHGIIAGEAAGAVLLETESHARRRGAPIYGYVASWARAVETKKWTVKSPTVSHGLSDAFWEALRAFEDKGKSINRVVMDVNGELHRAYEWAINEVRVFTRPGSEAYLAIPLYYTGDCGGASGAVVMMEAIGCLMLDEKAPERIALGTSEDAGARRVICLEKEKPPQADPKIPLTEEVIAREEFFAALRDKYKKLTRP